MTTNERGGDELKPMTKEERAALEIFQNLAHEDRKYDGGYVLDISLGVPAIAEALESTRRAAIAEAMESEAVGELRQAADTARAFLLALVMNARESAVTKHNAKGPYIKIRTALEKFDAYQREAVSLSENQTKGKGDAS